MYIAPRGNQLYVVNPETSMSSQISAHADIEATGLYLAERAIYTPCYAKLREDWMQLPVYVPDHKNQATLVRADEGSTWVAFLREWDLAGGDISELAAERWASQLPCNRALAYLFRCGYAAIDVMWVVRWMGHPLRYWHRTSQSQYELRLRRVARQLFTPAYVRTPKLIRAIGRILQVSTSAVRAADTCTLRDLLAMRQCEWIEVEQGQQVCLRTLLILVATDWLSRTVHPEFFDWSMFNEFTQARAEFTNNADAVPGI